MSKKRVLGFSTVATLLLGGGVALYAMPGIAVPDEALAASTKGLLADPAPQRFEIAQAQATGTSTLPGGASSLNETYRDWRVACAQKGTAKQCAMSQAQAHQNGQRVLAIELGAPAGNTVSGTLVLPFGLALDSGVIFQIDDKPAMQPVRFRTCVPAGCLVNISFDAATIVALRAGTALKIKATADGGAATPFSISLQGFGTALDRVATLAR
ncbi:invasion associated locus B family protein [Mesorhizobium sp. L-8-3]|uniref:invasion associated locus B family protein n=1 Tax=Mesorhizobium sp. L-8-3 TaxID=2744522 RepID=UPI001FD52822|nr:invasion associated locus B family protein [Mesorhizobium sp. L-8-3]